MAVLDYLRKQLTDFVSSFKNAKVNYEYDELAEIHTVEILPKSVFDSDEFAKWECDFFVKAYSEIPGEDVGFISEDAYVGIEHVDWSIQGPEYVEVNCTLDEYIVNNTSDEKVKSSTIAPLDFKNDYVINYEFMDSQHLEMFDFFQTDDTYKDSMVLNNNTTSMSFDDNLLQAA